MGDREVAYSIGTADLLHDLLHSSIASIVTFQTSVSPFHAFSASSLPIPRLDTATMAPLRSYVCGPRAAETHLHLGIVRSEDLHSPLTSDQRPRHHVTVLYKASIPPRASDLCTLPAPAENVAHVMATRPYIDRCNRASAANT